MLISLYIPQPGQPGHPGVGETICCDRMKKRWREREREREMKEENKGAASCLVRVLVCMHMPLFFFPSNQRLHEENKRTMKEMKKKRQMGWDDADAMLPDLFLILHTAHIHTQFLSLTFSGFCNPTGPYSSYNVGRI